MMEIRYESFKKKLLKKGYTEKEAEHLYGSVRAMDEQSRTWVRKWLNAGMLPPDEIEGITARYLIEEYHYAPLNAFIILDWLKTDPQAAKYFLMKGAADAQIGEFAAGMRAEITEEAAEEAEEAGTEELKEENTEG